MDAAYENVSSPCPRCRRGRSRSFGGETECRTAVDFVCNCVHGNAGASCACSTVGEWACANQRTRFCHRRDDFMCFSFSHGEYFLSLARCSLVAHRKRKRFCFRRHLGHVRTSRSHVARQRITRIRLSAPPPNQSLQTDESLAFARALAAEAAMGGDVKINLTHPNASVFLASGVCFQS
jgi:hypothetical protein